MADLATVSWQLARTLTFANGPDVDRSVWKSPQWAPDYNPAFFGRTAIRNLPDYGPALGAVPVQDNWARSPFPTAPWPPSSPTTCCRRTRSSHDEIDFEFASRRWSGPNERGTSRVPSGSASSGCRAAASGGSSPASRSAPR